jgi:hypothetical protein
MDEIIRKIDEQIEYYDHLAKIYAEKGKTEDFNQYNDMSRGANRIKEILLTEQSKPLTFGAEIRESNENLSRFIRGQFGEDRVFHGGNQIDLDDFLNQPTTGTP